MSCLSENGFDLWAAIKGFLLEVRSANLPWLSLLGEPPLLLWHRSSSGMRGLKRGTLTRGLWRVLLLCQGSLRL